MELDLERLETPSLPAGYSFSEVDFAKVDSREIQWMFWQGFDHGDDVAEFEEDYARTMRAKLKVRKHFDPELSVSAKDPSGERAAYCCVWFLDGTDYAYVEPVCTVPSHRGKGLAAALLTEALTRAKNLGAKNAYVLSDMEFYKRIGFGIDRKYTFYWKYLA